MRAKCCVCGAEDTCRALIGRVDYNTDPGAPVEVVAYFKDDRAFENWVCLECSGGSVDTFDFGEALSALKRGRKVARQGWNGKGMFLFLHTPEQTAEYEMLPYIEMKTADNKLVPWLASHTDLLAEDWALAD